MIPVNNQEYQRARKAGYSGSYKQWAEDMNQTNSVLAEDEARVAPLLLEVGATRQYMNDISNSTMASTAQDMIKTQTGFAIGGGIIGFILAIIFRRNWIPFTIAGLAFGALGGVVVQKIKKDDDEEK